MKISLQQTRLLVVLALFAVLLAACGAGTTQTTAPTAGAGGGTTGTAPAGGGTTSATAPAGGSTTGTAPAGGTTGTAPAGGTTGSGTALTLPDNCTSVALQFWNPFTGPDGPFMTQITDQFNADNPNIQVTTTSQSEYYVQLATAVASRTQPDVAIVHADQVATQAFRNVIRPLDNLAQEVGINASDFPPAVWQAGEVVGQRYSIPFDIHPAVLYYNEDMLRAAGINAPPTNEQEFAQAAAMLTQGNQKGYLVTSGDFSLEVFQTLLHQFGGSEFNQDVTQATWNSEAGVRALQWMKDAQARYGEPNLESDAEINGFKAGNAAMMITGIWQITNVTGEGVSFAGRGTVVPQIGPEQAVWADSHQLALPVQANPDPCKDAAAGIFIKYVLDNSVAWARAGQIPANNTVRNSAEFQAIEPQATIAPSVEYAFFSPAVPGITDAIGPLGEAVTRVMAGTQTDIQAALDEAVARSNQILEENRRNYGEAPRTP